LYRFSADMTPVLIALIRALGDSYLKIGKLIDARGFAVIMLTILLLALGGDWVSWLLQLARGWR
jgi:hypothetical protein